MKKIRSKKLYAAAALILSISMLAAGCSGSNDENDGSSAEGTESSVSVNVIGGTETTTTAIVTDDAGLEVEQIPTETVSTTAELETELVLDENGETVTGVGGNAITQPVVTTINTDHTLSDEDILNAITSQPKEVNISKYTGKRYAYDTLTSEEKELYDNIKSGAENLRFKICSSDAFTIEEWTKVYGLVFNQEPQLFYLSGKIKVGKLFYITKDADNINQMQKAIDSTVNKLVDQASGKSTYEQLKIFHDYLVLNSTFESMSSDADYNASIYNAFGHPGEQGDIQCAGYAKAMQYLCDKVNIPCMVVTGENTEGASHAWNVVQVDGEWYNLDCTWDDPILATANYKNVRYKFFLVPDSWIHNKTHMHVNEILLPNGNYVKYFDPPACTGTSQNYFVKSGNVYNDAAAAEKAIKDQIKNAAENGLRTTSIMAGSKDVYKAIYDIRGDLNAYAKTLSGVRGISDECNENMLVIEFDVLYN